jgi:hypothetical protein
MASWSDFESAAPQMAEAGRKLLYRFGLGLAFLATVRKDGAPRLHPICPAIVNGHLYALIGPSHKRTDLRRDGRYALHTFPAPNVDDEFLVMGHAAIIENPATAAAVRNDLIARGMNSSEDEVAFEFEIERVMYAKYPGGYGTWPPTYSVWKVQRR